MTIKFNQEMFAPNFDLSEISTTSERKLAMSRMNVERDLLDITVLQQVSQFTSPTEYQLELLEWNELEINVGIKFANSYDVSTEKRLDQILVEIKDPSMFTSKNMQTLDTKSAIMTHEVPRQLPLGTSEEILTQYASNAKIGSIALIVIQLGLNY